MGNSPSSTKVLHSNELVNAVLEWLAFADLTAVILLCHLSKTAVQQHVRRTIRCALASWFEDVDALRTMLVDTSSAVVGSFILRMLRRDGGLFTANGVTLDILVPRDCRHLWVAFLVSIGYSDEGILSYTTTTNIRNASIFAKSPSHRIKIWECTAAHILPVILKAPTTAHMNFLTASGLYCPYPFLTSESVALAKRHAMPHRIAKHLQDRGYKVHVDTSFMSRACGVNCPYVFRAMAGLHGVGKIKWEDSAESPIIANLRRKWRIGGRCNNIHCTNYALDHYLL